MSPSTSLRRFLLAVPATLLLALTPACREADPGPPAVPVDVERVVEASCGPCQLGQPGQDCTLAVRLDGVVYRAEGTGLDDHGDAHAPDGFCNAIRHARVTGHAEGDRFVVSRFELLPEAATPPGG